MRPIVQTGSYGEYIGQVVLSVNAQTHEVEAFDARNVSVAAMVGETPMATLRENSVVEQAYQVILAALVKADDEGNRPTGLLGAPLQGATQKACMKADIGFHLKNLVIAGQKHPP